MSDHETVSILFTGDFVPVNLNDEQLQNCFIELKSAIENSDLHVTNLEAPITSSTNRIIKSGPHLKSDPSAAQLLKAASVNVVCLANNHIYDYGEGGVLETIEHCSKLGIGTLGIRNANPLSQTFHIDRCKGVSIGFINFCEHEFSVRPSDELGANGFDFIDAWQQIKSLREMVDYIIVLYHGGNEYYNLPSPDMKRTFRYLADVGADAVISHHTHVFSGYEFYNGKPLIYGLGNFFFPYPGEPVSWHTGLACRLVISSSLNIEMLPIIQCQRAMKVELAQGEDKLSVLNEIEKLNHKISDDELLSEEWRRYAAGKRLGMLKAMPCLSKYQRLLLKLGISESIVFPEKRMVQFGNIIQCRAHFNLFNMAIRSKK